MTSYAPFQARRPSALPTVFAGAAFVLAVFLLFDRGGWWTPPPRAEAREVTARGELASLEQTFIEVFERCSPSVAHITTRTLVQTWNGVAQQDGAGSGFVWDDRGTVVTNLHVVQGAPDVRVAIGDRRFTAKVLNASKDYDLAVLRLDGNVSSLTPIKLGSSKNLKVGQIAIAIGNPFGFDQTMTTGIVSALNRNIQTNERNNLSGLIQVDAAINPGNSGGPLLDSAGLLIGVTTAIYSPSGASAGIGFAVPVDTVNEVVPALLAATTKPTAVTGPPRLGIGNATRFRSCPVDVPQYRYGAIFTEVTPGLGAETAGLKPFEIAEDGTPTQWGDVIVAVDDRSVRTFDDIRGALAGKKAGDKVTLRVVRGLPDASRLQTLTVVLGQAGN
jgi:S1-C subfamily serine protease